MTEDAGAALLVVPEPVTDALVRTGGRVRPDLTPTGRRPRVAVAVVDGSPRTPVEPAGGDRQVRSEIVLGR